MYAKKTVKEFRFSKSPTIRFIISILYFLWYAAKNTKRACVDKNYRSILLLQLLNSKNVHQTTPLTYMDQYPTIFSACRDYSHGKQDLKILSYGCPTGEEVLTLRKYFPTAQFIGADINKQSLAKCKKLPVDENITFVYSSSSEIQKHGPFDAIFYMAVLQRKPYDISAKGITNFKKYIPLKSLTAKLYFI